MDGHLGMDKDLFNSVYFWLKLHFHFLTNVMIIPHDLDFAIG